MKKCLFVAAVAVACLSVGKAQAGTITINFDDGINGTSIGAFYAAQGVTFTNARWDGFVSPGEDGVGAGGLKLVGDGAGGDSIFSPKEPNPIIATFAPDTVNSFSIYGLNVGENGVRIEAYDAGNTLIASDQAFGVGLGVDNHPLLVAAPTGIKTVRLFVPLSLQNEGMLFDNMTFTTDAVGVIPEPSSIAVWVGIGIAGLGYGRRRKKQKNA